MFRRNYPNYSAGIALNIPLRNRAAQSDYVTSELELRQSELGLQQNINQVRVDVQNAVIGLQQARARYAAAIKASALQQQTLDADQKRLALGASTAYQVVLDEQNVASAESAVVQALANYSHARIGLDEALGRTLEANNITFDEALAGTISRPIATAGHIARGCASMTFRNRLLTRAVQKAHVMCACVCSLALLCAQEPTVEPVRPSAFVAVRPYLPPRNPAGSPGKFRALRQPGSGRHALLDRAGCHRAGARKQSRHRSGALQPDPGGMATGALPRWRSIARRAQRRRSGR